MAREVTILAILRSLIEKMTTEMNGEEQENPIPSDKITEHPGLLPYAHTVGGVVIRPDDRGKIKGRAMTAMQQQTDRQMKQLYEQMQVLAEQAKGLQERKSISEEIYNAQYGFEPLIGHTYYLYEKTDQSRVLSLVAPEEWGKKLPYNKFIAEVYLLADHTWEIIRST